MKKFIILSIFILLGMYFEASCNTVKTLRENITIIDTKVNMEKLIDALIKVESNGNPNAISPCGTCVGVLQIKTVVVDDCNEYLKMKGKSKRYTYKDRFDKKKSIEMFYLIQERYRNFNSSRSKSDIEHMIRLWNGGCGYKIKATQKYYDKVMKFYNK